MGTRIVNHYDLPYSEVREQELLDVGLEDESTRLEQCYLDVRQILCVVAVQQHGPHIVVPLLSRLAAYSPGGQQGTKRAVEDARQARTHRVATTTPRRAAGAFGCREVCRSLARALDAVVQKEHYAGRTS